MDTAFSRVASPTIVDESFVVVCNNGGNKFTIKNVGFSETALLSGFSGMRSTKADKSKSKKNNRRKKIDWEYIETIARETFGVRRFRAGQREIIEKVLTGKHCLGVLPTGGGKSLCFQLPSMLLPATTVVVSPLIALMQDQEAKLDDYGVNAARLDSTLSAGEEDEIVESINEQDSRIVYVTPERLETEECLSLLNEAGVSLLVIDEAHCVSQWGHDFRPAYLSLAKAWHELGEPTMLALTATATDEVAQDILNQLQIPNAEVVRLGVDRKNLHFQVRATVNEESKCAAIFDVLNTVEGSGIIYCATVRGAEQVHNWLRDHGVDAGLYHGKLGMKAREQMQTEFMSGERRVMVATKAFGLGVDKPDVRFVIHYQFPDSVESYYQEAGRAGRDGKDAYAILLYQLEDKRVQTYFIGGKYPSHDDAWAVMQTFVGDDAAGGLTLQQVAEKSGIGRTKVKVILAYLEGAGAVVKKRRYSIAKNFSDPAVLNDFLAAYQARYTTDRERLEQIMHYAQTMGCRVQFIKRYFGEEMSEICHRCDNCSPPEQQAA